MTQFKEGIPLNITGPSYQDRSRPLSSQQTKNFYQQLVEEGKDQYILHSFPGLPKVGTGAGADRGMRNFAGVGYRIAGTKLQSFDSAGNHTDIGDIPGVNRMIITDDGFNLIMVGLDGQFQYDGSEITVITDSNIVGSTSAGFINSQVIYGNPVTNLFVLANPNDPDKANGLNAATPESNPDVLVRPYPFKQNVYMFGTESTEPYWNSGVGNPPLDRIDGQIFEVGLGAIHSASNTDLFLYWLGDDNAIYAAVGGQRRRISTTAISHAIESYSRTDDAIGFTYTFEGLNFYQITFPTANKTWVLNEALGINGWFEVSSGTSDGVYQGTSLINVYGKNFVADATNGNLYELDVNTFTNNGEIIQRRRITSTVDSKLFGISGKEVEISRLQIIMETGVGLITGQGVNPKIMIDVSFDGGRSWAEFGFADIGRLGETQILVEVFPSFVSHEMIFRLTTSDPVPYEIYSAAVDLRLTGA